MKIETRNLYLRKFTIDDVNAIHELFSDENAMRYVALLPALKSLDETRKRVCEWSKDNKHYALVKKGNDELVGYLAINPDSEESRKDTKELAFAIIKRYRHKGYLFEIILKVLAVLKENHIKYVRACCFTENKACKNLLEKLGFTFIQKGTFKPKNDKEYNTYEYRMTL